MTTDQLSNHSLFRIIAIYALTGLIWIYASDTVLGWLIHDPRIMIKIAIFKGAFFIAFTLLLYFLINRFSKALVSSEHELHEYTRFLRAVLDMEPECVYMLDSECNLTMMNRAGLEMIEADLFDQVNGQCVSPIVSEPYRDAFNTLTKQVFRGIPGSLEFEIVGLKGRPLLLETHAVPFRDNRGDIVALLGITRNITDRRAAETAFRESEERYRTVVDNIPLGVLLIDRTHHIVMVNKTHADMYGHPPEWFKGRFCYEVFENRSETCTYCPGTVCMADGEVAHAFTTGIRGDGTRFDAQIRSAPLMGDNSELYGFIEVVENITERKRAEEERSRLEQQLLHAQKLESLGVLASGIAHDFNNILMAIIGNADLALMRISRESPAVDNLHKIEQAAARAADLAKQMLAYSGRGKFIVETIGLNCLLEEMLHLLEVSISKKAVLRLNLAVALPSIEVDTTQIRQVIMNLVINASEAIGDKSGVIAVTTGCMDCTPSYLDSISFDENIPEGRYIYLEISDTGCGMNKETLARLFDPFFTTKFTGRGLGMAAVLGIVRGHKGAIKVHSEEGKGTSFKILIPASGQPVSRLNHFSADNGWYGAGKVLLVDDEEYVCGTGVEMLEELGFTVITACNGREAVEVFKNTPGIAFVILDLTMPQMDGEQCFRELRSVNPDVKVILSSGYDEQEVTQKFIGKGLAGFAQKPYRLSVLKNAIRGIG